MCRVIKYSLISRPLCTARPNDYNKSHIIHTINDICCVIKQTLLCPDPVFRNDILFFPQQLQLVCKAVYYQELLSWQLSGVKLCVYSVYYLTECWTQLWVIRLSPNENLHLSDITSRCEICTFIIREALLCFSLLVKNEYRPLCDKIDSKIFFSLIWMGWMSDLVFLVTIAPWQDIFQRHGRACDLSSLHYTDSFSGEWMSPICPAQCSSAFTSRGWDVLRRICFFSKND